LVLYSSVWLRFLPAAACRKLLVPAVSSSTAVPRFWLRVLRSADAAALAISSRDAAVLASLADVRFSLTSSSISPAEPGASKELLGKREFTHYLIICLAVMKTLHIGL
jgi:hypothetical protein